jgi:hypothetical protein
MSKFAITDQDGSLTDERYNTLEEAIEAAKNDVKEEPDSEVEIWATVKKVSSTLRIDVLDAD